MTGAISGRSVCDLCRVMVRPLPWCRRTRARGSLLFISLMSAAALSGCETVAPAGATGISVDAHGRPVIVFALCNDHVDGATIYRDRTNGDPLGQDSVSVREWDAAAPVTPATATSAELNTAAPSRSWRSVGGEEPLRPGLRYVAYGWTRDNTWYTGHVEFALDHLSALKPGQVLTQTYVEATDDYVDTVQSYVQFASEACA